MIAEDEERVAGGTAAELVPASMAVRRGSGSTVAEQIDHAPPTFIIE